MTTCADCVGYSEGGGYYLVEKYAPSMSKREKDLSWASETGIWMPKDVAATTCKMSKGFDQSAEYNIHKKPFILKFSFQCCNECAKNNGNPHSDTIHSLMVSASRRLCILGVPFEDEGVLP